MLLFYNDFFFNAFIKNTHNQYSNAPFTERNVQYYSFIILIASCLPWVPEKGTVGASGDLAPLAHLALGMMGEGKMWSPRSGWADAKYVSFYSIICVTSNLSLPVSEYISE